MRILIFGASLADGLQIGACECDVVSRWGETTHGLLNDFPNLEHCLGEGRYDLVVLVAGTNDMANDPAPMFAIDNLMRMHRKCHKAGVLLSVGVTIMHDEFNRQYIKRCSTLGIPVCPFMSEDIDTSLLLDDGIHFNPAGKNAFGDALYNTVYNSVILRFLFPLTRPSTKTVTAIILSYLAIK